MESRKYVNHLKEDALTKLRIKMLEKLNCCQLQRYRKDVTITPHLCTKCPMIHRTHQNPHLLDDRYQGHIHGIVSIVIDGAEDGAFRKTGAFDSMLC